MTQEEFVFVDRYSALGIPYPKLDIMCLGHCEGMGFFPVKLDDPDPEMYKLWLKAHNKEHNLMQVIKTAWNFKDISWLWKGFQCDGWHFIKCPDCNGTGKRDQL